MTRGTTNANVRGNTQDRYKRRLWLLSAFGDGATAPCSFCGDLLDVDTVTVDRHPVPGYLGGSYARDNIRPACLPCNATHGGVVGSQRRNLKHYSSRPPVFSHLFTRGNDHGSSQLPGQSSRPGYPHFSHSQV